MTGRPVEADGVALPEAMGHLGQSAQQPSTPRSEDRSPGGGSNLAAQPDLPLLLIDTTEPGKNDRAARRLSDWLDADRLALSAVAGSGHDLASALGVALGRWTLSPRSFPGRWR